MDQPYRLGVDDLRDSHLFEAYEAGRLEVRQDAGRVCCPHCGETVGVLVRGNPRRRRGFTRTLLVAHNEGPDEEPNELGTVAMVEKEIRARADRGLQAIKDGVPANVFWINAAIGPRRLGKLLKQVPDKV